MRSDSRIYVAGHGGLVGSALTKCLRAQGYGNLIGRTHAELDLTDALAVRNFLAQEKPEVVIIAAAKVGGIVANDTRPAEFIGENLAIQTHLIHESWRAGIRDLLFLGSSCIYPRDCPQPIRESHLLTGPLEATNRPYAIAKIAGVEMCWSYNRQYGTRYVVAMPSNLYGPGDNYDLQGSHVLPALIRKCHEARVRSAATLTAWGTGSPRREFLYSEDLADACLFMLQNLDTVIARTPDGEPQMLNVGSGSDLTIRELVDTVREVVGYRGQVEWDTRKPDGTPRKMVDSSRLASLGWTPKVPLRTGIELAYRDFCARYAGTNP